MAGNPLTDPTWPSTVADAIERVVGAIRARTTTPLIHVTRALVYGLLAAFLAITALVLFIIGATRGLQSVLDLFLSRSRAVYLSYLIVGGILCIAGWLVLRMRQTSES
jgi:cell division protein FtsX